MPMLKPITGNFTYTQKLNGWASLIHLTKSEPYNEYYRSSTPFIIDIPVKIENKPCHRPLLMIRRWKTWGLKNSYVGKKCHHG
jgi:hypothetical protein